MATRTQDKPFSVAPSAVIAEDSCSLMGSPAATAKCAVLACRAIYQRVPQGGRQCLEALKLNCGLDFTTTNRLSHLLLCQRYLIVQLLELPLMLGLQDAHVARGHGVALFCLHRAKPQAQLIQLLVIPMALPVLFALCPCQLDQERAKAIRPAR